AKQHQPRAVARTGGPVLAQRRRHPHPRSRGIELRLQGDRGRRRRDPLHPHPQRARLPHHGESHARRLPVRGRRCRHSPGGQHAGAGAGPDHAAHLLAGDRLDADLPLQLPQPGGGGGYGDGGGAGVGAGAEAGRELTVRRAAMSQSVSRSRSHLPVLARLALGNPWAPALLVIILTVDANTLPNYESVVGSLLHRDEEQWAFASARPTWAAYGYPSDAGLQIFPNRRDAAAAGFSPQEYDWAVEMGPTS